MTSVTVALTILIVAFLTLWVLLNVLLEYQRGVVFFLGCF